MIHVVSKLVWSLRKLRLPIKLNDLTLEIGSGGNPHPYSSVLLEKYVDDGHRLIPIRLDRAAVLADACAMPFRDKAFDFSISFHVLEHSKDPRAFLDEVVRVSRAGYLETPNILYEMLHPFDVHALELGIRDGVLNIRKKPDPVTDPFLANFDLLRDSIVWKKIFARDPGAFHVCLTWKDNIKYTIVNEAEPVAWLIDPPAGFIGGGGVAPSTPPTSQRSMRKTIIGLLRMYRVRFGRSAPDLKALLVCPECKGELDKERLESHLCCAPCNLGYEIVNGVPVMLPALAKSL